MMKLLMKIAIVILMILLIVILIFKYQIVMLKYNDVIDLYKEHNRSILCLLKHVDCLL